MITKQQVLDHMAVWTLEDDSEYKEGYIQALHDILDDLEGAN